MVVSAIVAVGKNLEIGKDNQLLWHLPSDMKYFKEITTGHHVIMGRKSYESISEKYRPLPNRVNVVVSRQTDLLIEGALVTTSIDKAIETAEAAGENEVFIIGGGQIYNLAIRTGLIDRLYITWVEANFDADTFFPTIDFTDWNKVSSIERKKDERNAHKLTFSIYNKK
ncbi:MAG: dihydrofolate reductase [Flavobacteriales bacterium]|nr:dihydrofolate reductase [Flavobacteriales bacterium]